jgi:hypothetical protein
MVLRRLEGSQPAESRLLAPVLTAPGPASR